MNIKRFLLFSTIVTCFSSGLIAYMEKAVTYETTGGRFGDNLISYMHAKWISYKYNLPLLYRPFIYSDQLVMHEKEHHYTDEIKKNFGTTVHLGRKRSVHSQDTSVLYWVPYFPESKWELKNCIGYSGGPWDYIEVDWKDQAFFESLRQVIKPRNPLTQPALPIDRITVAVHMRRGGNHDPHHTVIACPLKFLPNDFFIDQIERIYHLLNNHPLYVHIFTDDHHPTIILEKFKNHFKSYDIHFGCREHNNSEITNVLEDFFALQQFDCLIHSESNYSLTASKLGDYIISIYPDSFYKHDNQVIYDHINVAVNQHHKKWNLCR